ncbi:MAG: sulfotransferase [Actinomycetota bacterium]|nr:sulfotransferase [Actinomycetota bacterium]
MQSTRSPDLVRAACRHLREAAGSARRRIADERGRLRAAARRSAGLPWSEGDIAPLFVHPIEGRSGTTLMMKLLDVPEIAFDRIYPFENRYFGYLAHLVTPMSASFDPEGPWTTSEMLRGDPTRYGPIPFHASSLDPTDFRIRSVRHLWQALAESLAGYSRTPLRYYAEKAWGNSLELLAEAGIKAKVINLVRDPRDVVSSIRAMDEKRGYFGFGRTDDMSEDDYLQFVVATMRRNLDAMSSAEAAHDCRLVRYEDIVRDPELVTRDLGSWLGVELDADRSVLAGPIFDRHATSSSAEQSIGKWKVRLTEREVTEISRVLGASMQRFGYEASG